MPTIQVDDDVLAALLALAQAPTDTPNLVLARLLALKKAQENPSPWRSRRAVTPKSVYENHLLYVLGTKFKGRASKREATEAVLQLMQEKGLLPPTASEILASNGETKAENVIAWSRNVLKEAGLVKPGTARGVWELTSAGIKKSRDPALLAPVRPSKPRPPRPQVSGAHSHTSRNEFGRVEEAMHALKSLP